MGWNSGGQLMEKVVKMLHAEVGDPDKRFHMYVELIDAWLDMDCDVLYEAKDIDPEYDRAYRDCVGSEEDE